MFEVSAQDTIQYLDTIFYSNQSKQAVNVIDFSGMFIEYEVEDQSGSSFLGLDKVDYVKLRDGMILQYDNQNSPKDILAYKRKQDSLKREKDLLIGSNLLALARYYPYFNPIINIGSRYYYKSSRSIGVDMYIPAGFSNDGAQLDCALECNFGISTNYHSAFDIGFRTGVQFSLFHYYKYRTNLVEKYSSNYVSGARTEYYEGQVYYYYDYYRETSKSKVIWSSIDPYVCFEAQYKIKRLTFVSNIGLKYAPNLKYDFGSQESHYLVKEFYSSTGTFLHSTTTRTSSENGSGMSDYSFTPVFRASLFFQIAKIKNK